MGVPIAGRVLFGKRDAEVKAEVRGFADWIARGEGRLGRAML
jgi:hypothetical protein